MNTVEVLKAIKKRVDDYDLLEPYWRIGENGTYIDFIKNFYHDFRWLVDELDRFYECDEGGVCRDAGGRCHCDPDTFKFPEFAQGVTKTVFHRREIPRIPAKFRDVSNSGPVEGVMPTVKDSAKLQKAIAVDRSELAPGRMIFPPLRRMRIDERCRLQNGDRFCTLRKGHYGVHTDGYAFWEGE